MTQTRGGNCGHIRPLRFACDDRLVGNCFVGVARQSGGEMVELGYLDGETSPAKVEASLDFEFQTQVAMLDAVAVVEPRARRGFRAAAAIKEMSHLCKDRLSEAIGILDFRSARQSCR